MQVVSGIFGSQIIPVTGFGCGFQEITILHKDQVGIQQLGQFLLVFGIQGISAAISFGDNNGRTVETDMANNNALRESAGLRILRVDKLGDTYKILFGINVRFQLFDTSDPFQGGKLLLQFARRGKGSQGTEKREKQKIECSSHGLFFFVIYCSYQSFIFGSFHSRPRKDTIIIVAGKAAKVFFFQRQESQGRRKSRFTGRTGKAVPGTDLLTGVATVEAVTQA